MLWDWVRRRRTSRAPRAMIHRMVRGMPTTTPPPANAKNITGMPRMKPAIIRVSGVICPSPFPRVGPGQTKSAPGPLQAARVDELEVAALHPAERVEVVVAPAPVGGARDEPGRAVVRHQGAVALEGPQHHPGLARKGRFVEAP